MKYTDHFLAVLRRTDGDCTNSGVSSKLHYITIVAIVDEHYKPSGMARAELELVAAKNPGACVVEMRAPTGTLYPTIYPLRAWLDGKWLMAGGNYAHSTDSRWRDLYPAPLPIHDRIE
jgi:hypothetical protein